MQTVQFRPFVKQWGFRGIEILGRGIAIQRPTAEGDDPATPVADRKDDAVAETVAQPALRVTTGQPGGQQFLGGHPLAPQRLTQMIPAGRRITDAENAGDLASQTALAQIIHRPLPSRMGAQLLAKEPVGLGDPLQQRPGRIPAAAPLGQFQPRVPGQLLHGVQKFQPLVGHQKADGVATRAAAEAVIKLLAGTDRKGWSFFGVKRATGREFTTRPAQRHPAVDDLDEIHPAQQLIKEFLGYAASHSPKA